MTTLAALCAQTGIDEAAVREALGAHASHDDAPWYMQAVLGIGAWVTAIAGLFFVWAVMDLGFGVEEPNLVVAIVGAAVFTAGLWLLHRRPAGAFSAHIAVAFATAGTLLAAAGVGVPENSLWLAAVATLPFVAAAIWQQRSLLLQFLIVAVSLILWIGVAWDHSEQFVVNVGAIAIPFGVALLLYPPRLDLRPTAFALLVVPQGAEMLQAPTFEGGWWLWHGLLAKVLFLVVIGFLFAINLGRLYDRRGKLTALAAALAIAAVALLLPTGASAALVLLLLAYTLGSRSLAAIGALAEVYFIWRFYADIQSTLLTKSIILMSAGGILIACYGLLATRGRPS